MIQPLRSGAAAARRLAARLRGDERGNVLMITGLAILILTFATGMGIDYSRAMRLQTKLNAASDAAALAGVTEPMMLDTTYSDVYNAVKNMFKSQITSQPGLVWSDQNLSIIICGNTNNPSPDASCAGMPISQRTVLVSYRAQSTNAFASILRMPTLTIKGSSKSTATAAPNINFYLALDTSPSMALPTTSAGLARMDSMVSCTFACHSNQIQNYAGGASLPKGMITAGSNYSNPYGVNYSLVGPYQNSSNGQYYYKIDAQGSYIYINAPASKTVSNTSWRSLCSDPANGNDICIYNADGTFVDSYWYALNQGISLRVTAERGAIADLMTLAKSYSAQNNRTYQAALYTFDYGNSPYNNIQQLASMGSLDAVSAASSKINVVTVNDKVTNGCAPAATGKSCSGTYLFTSFASVMNRLSVDMPAISGTGTNNPGDTPQAFMFLVTDGMSDEDIGSGRTRAPMQQAQLNQCTAIKARGIKIAILYTEYTTASVQDDQASDPSQYQLAVNAITQPTTIAQALTQCASSPDLMYTVSNNQDMSAALQTLFTRAVATAKLTK